MDHRARVLPALVARGLVGLVARGLVGLVARGLVGLLAAATGLVVTATPASADARPGGKLVAGGFFTQAGGTTATGVAASDGVAWSALAGPNGEGVDGLISAFTMYNGKLVVGGSFLTAGGETVSGVATWDGTDWAPLISSNGAIGVSILPLGFVADLEVYNGDLYAGGMFQRAGGTDVNNIARWNGTDWLPVTGPSGFGTENFGSTIAPVWDMTQVDGNLAVAGEFTSAGGVAANSVALWNGTTWASAGQPISPVTVLAVENFNGRLVASRGYSEAADVAWRDGGVWSVLGGTPGGFFAGTAARDLANYSGMLVAAGGFTQVGGVTVNRVAAWNGSSWSGLTGPSGTGTSGDVLAVTLHFGFLYVGGFFTSAGGQPASNIARWNGSAWSAVPGGGTDDGVFELLST